MDFDTPYQPYYGVPNNPPPQLPDTSGARGQQAVWRIAHSLPPGDQHSYSLNDGNAFPWQRSVSDLPARTEAFDQDAFESLQDRSTLICQGTNSSIPPGMSDFYQSLNPLDERNAMLWQGTGLTVPAGTRVFDQHASQPLNLNFDANYQFTGGDLGGHAYLPQSIERLPDLHHDYFEIATMTGILPETSTIPQNSGSTQSLFYTGESAAQSQQLPLDGTTIGHLSTLPQISSQASWENTETIYGDYNNLEVTDEIFDPYHGLVYDLALEQTREQLQSEAMHMTLSNNPSQGDQSATQGKSPEETRICGTKRKAPDLERERKRHRIPDLKSSDGAMDVFEYSLDHLSIEVSRKKAQGPRNNVVCFLCRIRQKKCDSSNKICNLCYKSGLPCIKNSDPVPPFTNPDISMDNTIDLSQQMECPLFSSKTWNAIVFVRSSPYGPIVPLSCKVNFRNLNVKSLQEMVIQSEIWDDMQDSRDRTDVDWERRASCNIPNSSMPSHEQIQQWALQSLESDPASGIGNLHGHLFSVATKYIHSCNRPLHNLVSLTRAYAAIYSVCNSKLSLLLDTRPEIPDKTYQVCPWLRAQICVPVLRALGAEVEQCLKKAISEYRSDAGESAMAMCVVFWFLILMYQHSDAQRRRAIWLHMDPEYISSEDILNIRQQLGKSLEFIRDLYKICFIQMTGSVCPIFNDNLKLKCGTEAQNIELQIAVANMRTSLRQYLEDAQPTDELAELCLRELINSIQKVRVQKNLKGTQMTSQPRVPTFESMGSDPDDLDFSKCSIMAYAQKGDDNTLLRDLDLRGDEEDYPNTDWNPIFRLMGDKMSELHDWGFNKDLTEAVGYDSDENLLQDLEGQKKEAATQKWKQSAVGIDSEMTDF